MWRRGDQGSDETYESTRKWEKEMGTIYFVKYEDWLDEQIKI